MKVEIHLPPRSDDAVSEMLRAITRAIVEQDNDKHVEGFLGGAFGYGCEWSSSVFEMRPDHPDCSLMLPNFKHHASGMTVEWYKYIGRGMEIENAPPNLTPILRDCLDDIANRARGGDDEG